MSYKKLTDLGKSSRETFEEMKETYNVVPEITTLEDKQSLIMNNKVVVVDVYADWCGPCQTAAPMFAQLYDKYKDLCKLVKENVDLRLSPTVHVIPTFQIYVHGKLKSQITGANLEDVEKSILDNLNAEPPKK